MKNLDRMKEKFCIVVKAWIMLLLITNSCHAQDKQYQFNLVEGPNGKPLGKIRNITQDPHGYMWFAGESENCIFRYDGNRMTAFRHDDANPNSLGATSINSVYADDAGMIWIGLSTGLDQFNPATGVFKHFLHNPNDSGSVNDGVTTVLRDRQGRLWAGGYDGLNRLNEKTGKFIHYRNEPGNQKSLSSNVVWCLYEDHQGVIWVGTGDPFFNKNPEDGGLNRLEPDGTFTRYMHHPKDPHSLINNKVAAIFEDSRGSFWVGTSDDGLHTMDRKTGRFTRHLYNPKEPGNLSRPPLRPGAINDKITFITGDSTGAIWIGTMYAGINRYDTGTKKITHFEHSNGFPDNTSWNAFTSRDGVVWITTEQKNLYRVDQFIKSIYSVSTSDQAIRFLEDNEGFLWVGTFGGGLLKYEPDGKLINQFKHDSSNSFSFFDRRNNGFSLFQNQENILWLGTGDGVGFFNKLTQQFSRLSIDIKFNPQMPWRPIRNIIEDKQGLKWFASSGGGLVRYSSKDGSVKQYLPDKKDSSSISSDLVVALLEDRSGIIWSGGQSGINRLDRKTDRFSHYLKGSFVETLFEDKEGTIWAGTRNGLYRYNKTDDSFLSFLDPNAEVSTLNVNGILQDEAKNLWLLSPSAIINLNPVTKETFIYGSRFGITYSSLQKGAVYIDSKGRLLVGHQKGYYSFFPHELSFKIYPLKIVITDIFINNLPVLSGKESVLLNPVEDTRNLVLKYNQNNISFNFTAIDYREPEHTKYFTMLENYDNTWREAKGEKSSNYFNIPPGNYVYRIKAFNSDGTKAEKEIGILINPPWWQTWWAYILYIFLLIGAIWGFIKWRTRALSKEKIVLEEKVAQRTKELRKEKETVESTLSELKSTQAQLIQSEKMASLGELTAGIAHEIQNPLNFVNNFSEVNTELIVELKAEVDKGNLEEVKAIANVIEENEQKINHHGKRADAIVKGMLQHSRANTGKKEPTDINALADEYLRLSYHGLRAKDKDFNALMKTNFDESICKIEVVSQDIGRVLLNFYNNAFYAVNEKKKQMNGTFEPAVEVSTKRVGDKVEISVNDNGIGIPKKVLDKIFQPFFTTKPTGLGTGLGLSLSYDIVKAHGGEIKVETKEGEGTTFIIHIPVGQV